MAYRAADSKREEFRKYLEKAGVLDAMTKVLVGLYEEPEKVGLSRRRYGSLFNRLPSHRFVR